MNTRAPKTRGFTLIELAVVVGIVAVLIAILIPSLAAARRSVQAAGCQSNLRTTYTALKSHQTEHNNHLPVAHAPYLPGAGHTEPVDSIAKQLDIDPPRENSAGFTRAQPWVCPADRENYLNRNGWSYFYHAYMVFNYYAVYTENVAGRVAAHFEANPDDLLIGEGGHHHTRSRNTDKPDPSGRFELLYNGTIIRADER